jgi:hypothetical protein
MSIDYLEKQLAHWKQLLLVCIGAGGTLLASAIADIPNHANMNFPGWYGVWLILQLATITPAVLLLLGSAIRELPIAARLNTIFGYLTVTWMVLIAFGLKLSNIVTITWMWYFLGIFGSVMGIVYWVLRMKYIDTDEATFL